MKTSFSDIIRMKFAPSSTDAALLVSRVWLGLSMFGLHAWISSKTSEAW